jgi:hypothetical protein
MRLTPYVLGWCLLAITARAGTFYNPVGDPAIAEKGARAAAELNDALSSLHLMYAAAERKDAAKIEEHRKIAIDLLTKASEQFQSIEAQMPRRELKVNPTSAEKETVENLFRYTIPAYQLPPPKTEGDLVNVAVVIIKSLIARLEKGNIGTRKEDWRALREVIRIQLDLTGAGLAVSLIFAAPK